MRGWGGKSSYRVIIVVMVVMVIIIIIIIPGTKPEQKLSASQNLSTLQVTLRTKDVRSYTLETFIIPKAPWGGHGNGKGEGRQLRSGGAADYRLLDAGPGGGP